jgi:hypothetical protein
MFDVDESVALMVDAAIVAEDVALGSIIQPVSK